MIICAPLTDETKHAINSELIEKLKDSYIINVGRGEIIDEEALYQGLLPGGLAGFASDVWFHYPKKGEDCYPSIYPLHEMKHVIMTPHNAGFEEKSRQVRYDDVLTKINEFLHSEQE
jgi:phosphoglycerate dehydrogenase-like enzyme